MIPRYDAMNKEEPDLTESLRPVLHHVLLTHEEEKRTAALTLHDEIAQNLSLISMHLSVMRKQNAINPEVVPDVISKIQGIIASTQNRVRGLEFGLYPKVVELSITDAVNGLLRRLTEERGSAIDYTSPPAIKCGRKSAIGLYRVLEQFFAQTHGRTRAWSVSLMESTAGVALSIRPTTAFPGEKEAMGVDVLTQEIVLAHGGRISMASEPHRIEIVFPKE